MTLSLFGCRDEAEGELEVTIENGGAPFEISAAGHPFQGFQLSIPEDTFPGASEWSFAVVTDPDLPELPPGFSASGPALQIRTDQLRGEKLMTLDVPVTRTEGEEVVIAFYDPARRIFEVLPKVAQTDSSVRVVTAHLRPDLLLGPRSATAAQPQRGLVAGFGTVGGPPPGYLLPVKWIAFEQMREVPGPRWPVVDHGSGPLPEGSALSIVGFEAMGALPSFPDLFKPLATPGFYSDAAPLAATVDGYNQLFDALHQLVHRYNELFAQLGKAETDDLVHQTVVANLSLTQLPTPLVVMEGPEGARTFVNAVAGSVSALKLNNPASSAPLVLNRVATTGFEAVSVVKTAGDTTITIDRAYPLPSFVFPFERITHLARALEQLAEGANRRAINASLSSAAGLPEFKVELRIDPSAPWVTIDEENVVIRDEGTELRVTPGPVGDFMIHGPDGNLVAESAGAPIAANTLTGVSGSLLDHPFSLIQRIGARVLQAAVMNVRLARAPLTVTPETQNISEGDTEVSFEASFDHPPAGGFRMRWEWGDGETTEELGLTTASHTYDAPGDYTVKVTLLSAETAQPLGSQTVQVQSGSLPFWRVDTFSDPAGLYEDYTGPADAFQRMLSAPQAGLIAITETGPGESALELKVLDAETWNLTVCCPPAGQGPLKVVPLGKLPSTQEPLGPYFSAWTHNSWAQSTPDLDSGTLTGEAIQGTMTYEIPDNGGQLGPAGHVRLDATRSGASMTGTFYVTIWFVDDETGELDEAETYPFPFTATRLY